MDMIFFVTQLDIDTGTPITVTFGGDADVTFDGDTVTFGVE